ncbi:hypothetical protein FCM35_KLT05054 [Carex littledalei]|uniref:Uncharacterized protein n=1 Tax=Carex littledalei TaxID=544730 RepID=A0A833R4J7_9POAL|nr:hypothetical protein FCM35_KLT05054 [Carex littledalei]
MEYLVESTSVITGEGERCSSTESGWTLYLASPLDDDAGEMGSDLSVEFHDSTGENRVEEDDSLASDASTGNNERNVTTTDDHVSNLSTNIKEKSKKMERREERRCFGGLFKRGGSSSSCSSKIWKTKLTW